MISAPRSTSGSSIMRRLLSLGSMVAALGLLAATGHAEAQSINATNSDTLTSNSRGQVQVTLARANFAAPGAMIKALKTLDEKPHITWSGSLTKSGNSWTTTIDREAFQHLLMATSYVFVFPGKGQGGEDLEIVMERDDHVKGLGPAATIVGAAPLFYDAPEVPTPPADLSLGANYLQASSYIMAARRYDEELSALAYSIEAELAGAHAYWLDMKTANTLTEWPASVIATQEKAYADLGAKVGQIRQSRLAHRAKAEAAVAAWNANNPNAEMPAEIEFRSLTGSSS